jgi:hypothetical protein
MGHVVGPSSACSAASKGCRPLAKAQPRAWLAVLGAVARGLCQGARRRCPRARPLAATGVGALRGSLAAFACAAKAPAGGGDARGAALEERRVVCCVCTMDARCLSAPAAGKDRDTLASQGPVVCVCCMGDARRAAAAGGGKMSATHRALDAPLGVLLPVPCEACNPDSPAQVLRLPNWLARASVLLHDSS